MALPCCLPLIDDQADSVHARANWATVCGGALRRRRANSARALCTHTGLASAIALRGEVIWHLAVVVSRMKASPCRPHLQQNCTILCPPLWEPCRADREDRPGSIFGPRFGTPTLASGFHFGAHFSLNFNAFYKSFFQ